MNVTLKFREESDEFRTTGTRELVSDIVTNVIYRHDASLTREPDYFIFECGRVAHSYALSELANIEITA